MENRTRLIPVLLVASVLCWVSLSSDGGQRRDPHQTNLAIFVEYSEAIPRHKYGGEARPTVRTRCISRRACIRIESD